MLVGKYLHGIWGVTGRISIIPLLTLTIRYFGQRTKVLRITYNYLISIIMSSAVSMIWILPLCEFFIYHLIQLISRWNLFSHSSFILQKLFKTFLTCFTRFFCSANPQNCNRLHPFQPTQKCYSYKRSNSDITRLIWFNDLRFRIQWWQ